MTRSLLSRVMRKLWYLVAAIIIFTALLVSMTRLITPVLNEHRADFEKLASRLLQMPVLIRDVDVEWHGYTPQISLHSVTLLDAETLQPKLKMQKFRINFSLWQSLRTRSVYINDVSITGVELTVTQQASGEVQIGNITSVNIKDQLTGSSLESDAMFAWIFTQARLTLEDIDVNYLAPNQPKRFITLKELTLRNLENHHIVDGKAVLHQQLPVKVHLHLGWDGDARKMAEAKGHFYLYLEGLSLPQWFSQEWSGVQVKKGIASVKLWARWNNRQWEKMQTVFEVYGLELYSDSLKQTQAIDRVSASLGWMRNGKVQTFAGDQIFIDFPYHLWPSTSFSVSLLEDPASAKFSLAALQFNYLNLGDSMRVLTLIHTALPDDIWQKLQALNPRGEIQNFKADLPAPMTKIQDMVLTSQFSGLTVNPWNKFPGVTNFKGTVDWNKNQGELRLDNANVFLAINQVFDAPLYFNKMLADIDFQRADNGDWSIQGKNINIANADITADAKFSVHLPQAGSSDIDFTATYNVPNAKHLAKYMPQKIYDPDLAKWLAQAFRGGSASGTAVVQGPLKDIPFDGSSGKFLISTQINHLDFSFAPDWPLIKGVNGTVVFSGRTMTVNIESGTLANVPLHNIVGIIPYLGADAPQILNVDGTIQSDLATGLNFIHASPLEKTIGEDLSQIKFAGPMALKLSLSVPLKKPDLTKVLGDVTMTNATLNLPAWKLVLNKVNGAFEFTDVGISGKNIQGQFFGSPITLNLTTVTDAKKPSGHLSVDIASTISVKTLESWSGASLSRFVQGETPFSAQVLVTPHKEGVVTVGPQLTITSDLKNVAFDLPAPYGKKAGDARPFQLVVNGDEKTDLMNVKLDYNKQLSAALTFKMQNQAPLLRGGEISVGGKQASLQSEAGLLITGRMPRLDVDVWQKYFESLNMAPAKNANLDLKMLRGINLKTNILNGMGQQLRNVSLDMSIVDKGWQIKIDSTEIAGDLRLPFDLQAEPVRGKFDRIRLNKSNKQSYIDPRKLPSMELEASNIQVGDVRIDHMTLELIRNSAGLIIRQLHIDEPALGVNATGSWSSNGGTRSSTHIEGAMDSSRVSDALQNWGFDSSNLVCKKGSVKFNLSWPDAPYQPALRGMNGNISFDFGPGTIVHLSESSNAKIGLGRLLNVFDLTSLPRRLSMDFRDVTQKGYNFDYMKADFAINNGSAVTNNMVFDGSVARVEIKGRLGFVAKDLDVRLAVKPYVTGGLPVVAAFAGGPVVGVAALLVEKVVSRGVSQAITYNYSVTGPWSNPSWAQISASGKPGAPQSDSQFPSEKSHHAGVR